MGRNKNNREFWTSGAMNNMAYRYYYDRLTELAISSIKWNNLPDTIDSRFMELVLFRYGQAVFFEDEVMGYLCLTNALNGNWDVYNIPKLRRAYATNGYQKQLTKKDSVVIYNNLLHTNSARDVRYYAGRLAQMDRIIDINVNAQKTPVMIKCDETERLTMENLYMKYDGNQPFIWGDKSLSSTPLETLNTGAPYVAEDIYNLKEKVWNEALTCLGISNLTVNKKERLITDEVQRSIGGTIASRKSRLKARQQAADMINDMFGLELSVEFEEDTGNNDYDGKVFEEEDIIND